MTGYKLNNHSNCTKLHHLSWTFATINRVISHKFDSGLIDQRMAENKTPSANNAAKHQRLFRMLAGLAAVATLISASLPNAYDTPLLIFLSIILLYSLVAHVLIQRIGLTKIKQLMILSRLDAVAIGALIAWIGFDPLPTLLFLLLLEFNALITGGIQKLVPDNIAMVVGVLIIYFIKQPAWVVHSDLETSLAVLIALGLYFCIYGLYTFTQSKSLKSKIDELERQQVQFKLRNYRLSKYLSPTLGRAIQSGKDVRLETQRKKLTIFFSDIKGFSELAEEMEADSLTALLNNYLTENVRNCPQVWRHNRQIYW